MLLTPAAGARRDEAGVVRRPSPRHHSVSRSMASLVEREIMTRKHHTAAALTIVLVVSVLAVAVIVARPGPGGCGEPGRLETVLPSVAKDSQPLPRLRLLRTLLAPNEQYPLIKMVSGTSNLTWSPDGQRLAAYVRNGLAIMVWSPDGKVRHEIPRYNSAGLTSANVLGFLSGHSQLLTGPAASDAANTRAVEDVAFSVLDAETGKVVHNVVGLNPGKSFRENIAWKAAISPDQRLVAVVYNVTYDQSADRRIGVYSTDGWQRIAAIPFGDNQELPRADAINFSPDGKMLAVAYRNRFGTNNHVDIFHVDSWTLRQSIKTFPEAPPKALLSTAAVSFNPDGSMISVILFGGGVYWKYPNGSPAPKGAGTLIQTDVPEPLRVFKISDGRSISSAGGFAGGLEEHKMEWSSVENFVQFLDLDGFLYFWNPLSGDPPHEVCQLDRTTTAISFSPNGKMLGQGFADGANLYEILK
jgi:WD40 repeat protein